jgi:hypothetical protein
MAARALFTVLFLMSLGGASLHAASPGGSSKFFTVSGQVKNPTGFDLRKLQQFAPHGNATYCAMGRLSRPPARICGTC